MSCDSCCGAFERHSKGMHRQSTSTLASPRTLHKVFNKPVEGFLCRNCVKYVRAHTVRVRRGKVIRRTWPTSHSPTTATGQKRLADATSPPNVKRTDKRASPTSRSPLMDSSESEVEFVSFKDRAIGFIRASKYSKALTTLVLNSPSAKQAIIKMVGQMIKRELSSVTKRKCRRT